MSNYGNICRNSKDCQNTLVNLACMLHIFELLTAWLGVQVANMEWYFYSDIV